MRTAARGLLAASTPEALRHFKNALSEDPASPRANVMYATLLIISGRFSEARDQLLAAEVLFPENPIFRVLHAMLEALTEKPEAAQEHLKLARRGLCDSAVLAAESLVEICLELPRLGRQLERLQCGDNTTNTFVVLIQFNKTFGSASKLLTDQVAVLLQGIWVNSLHLRKALALETPRGTISQVALAQKADR